MIHNKKITIIHYCCGKFPFSYGGVARFDYHLKLAFPQRFWFQGPSGKADMLKFIKTLSNYIIVTDNHLACDIPNNIPCIIVHHGCAKTTSERDPAWNGKLRNLCVNGQEHMLKYRSPTNTLILSCSQNCIDDFTKYYPSLYSKFEKKLLLHTSELRPYERKKYNELPVVLGNWFGATKKGGRFIDSLKKLLENEFEFRPLNVEKTSNINLHNELLAREYQKADIFLQLSVAEGNSYATLDAFCNDMLICGTNVGLLYDLEKQNVGVIFPWEKMSDIDFVASKLRELWKHRNEYNHRSVNWFKSNVNMQSWFSKFTKIINEFVSKQFKKQLLPVKIPLVKPTQLITKASPRISSNIKYITEKPHANTNHSHSKQSLTKSTTSLSKHYTNTILFKKSSPKKVIKKSAPKKVIKKSSPKKFIKKSATKKVIKKSAPKKVIKKSAHKKLKKKIKKSFKKRNTKKIIQKILINK